MTVLAGLFVFGAVAEFAFGRPVDAAVLFAGGCLFVALAVRRALR